MPIPKFSEKGFKTYTFPRTQISGKRVQNFGSIVREFPKASRSSNCGTGGGGGALLKKCSNERIINFAFPIPMEK